MQFRRILSLAVLSILVAAGTIFAQCDFTTVGATMNLNASCDTDATILIPDGVTLDGNNHTVRAVDPAAGHFTGAVVMNGGTTANVINLTVEAAGLINVCDGGANRLRGIMFEGASGFISHATVQNINQGPSGCQEGNAIEVRNAPFDGTHPNTQYVTITHNVVTDYQKTGIVANGDVSVVLRHNKVGASATQNNLAPNSVQVGFGGHAIVRQNQIDGNQWLGPSNYVGTAMLLYLTESGSEVRQNNIRGNADVGIYVYGDEMVVDNNKVFDAGPDGGQYDIGIGNWGADNAVTNNKVRGFDIPYDGVTGGKNKKIPGPQKNGDAFLP